MKAIVVVQVHFCGTFSGRCRIIDERFDLNNLVCLCHGCHTAFHIKYGNKHNTKEQYVAFKLSKTQGKVE